MYFKLLYEKDEMLVIAFFFFQLIRILNSVWFEYMLHEFQSLPLKG